MCFVLVINVISFAFYRDRNSNDYMVFVDVKMSLSFANASTRGS